MEAIGIMGQPWAIKQSVLNEMQAIARGIDWQEKIKAQACEDMPRSGPEPVRIVGQAAVIAVHSVLEQRLGFLSWVFSCTSYEVIRAQFTESLNNSQVNRIVLDIDSPGGSVFGVADLAELIFESRDKKEIVALINNCGCSAAYWLASACSKVYLASGTALSGSIGVILAHEDVSKANEAEGIKVTEIVAGKYKNMASGNNPITDAGKAHLQEVVDKIYAVFLEAVAKYRGSTVDAILKVAEGKEYIGQDAVNAGLADGIVSFENVVSGNFGGVTMPDEIKTKLEEEKNKDGGAAPPETTEAETDMMDNEETMMDDEEKKKKKGEPSAVAQKAILAERKRINAIDAIISDDNRELATKAKAEGWTPQEFSYECMKAKAKTKKPSQAGSRAMLQALKDESYTVPSSGTEDISADDKQLEAAISKAAKATNALMFREIQA